MGGNLLMGETVGKLCASVTLSMKRVDLLSPGILVILWFLKGKMTKWKKQHNNVMKTNHLSR